MKKNVVVKFGGTSVTGVNNIYKCIERVIELHKQNNVVVVVSAESGVTNLLEQKIQDTQINDFCTTSADLIKSTGEMVSVGLFVAALKSLGFTSSPLCGWQLPIITKDRNIMTINIDKINKLLDNDTIPVVAGFQGMDIDGNITTLTRGGSDITAVALSKYLNLSECYIYTDISGVYRISPKLQRFNHINRLINRISYQDMYDLAKNGAKVVHPDAVEMARESKIDLYINSSFNHESNGTLITNTNEKEYGITSNNDDKVYLLHNGKIPDLLCKDDVISCNERFMYIHHNSEKLEELCAFFCEI